MTGYFLLGVAIGAGSVACLWTVAHRMSQAEIIRAARERMCLKVRGEFLYVIASREFAAFDLFRRAAQLANRKAEVRSFRDHRDYPKPARPDHDQTTRGAPLETGR